jgi:cytosine/adenosine deaminase-related metal-dependent hydrolase
MTTGEPASVAARGVSPCHAVDVRIIQGGGRTLMPGPIAAHVHLAMAAIPMPVLMTADNGDFRMPYEVPAARNASPSRGEAIRGITRRRVRASLRIIDRRQHRPEESSTFKVEY